MADFPDVGDDNVFKEDIDWATHPDIGIAHGFPDGLFRPWDETKRGQMCKMIRNAVRLIDPALAEIPDEPEPPPDVDAVIEVGADAQAVIDAAGEGAVVGFAPGVHSVTVTPRTGQTLTSAVPGQRARLDGLQARAQAIVGSAPHVKLSWLEITGYLPPAQEGVVGGEQEPLWFQDGGWHLEYMDIHDNGALGVRLRGNNATIRTSKIIRADQLGFSIGFGYDGLVEDVEVAFANYNDRYAWEWEGGGCKAWESDRLILRRIWSHHNHGPGLWCDNANVDTLYEDNDIEDNHGPGIFHEISHGATIRNNRLARNGYPVDPEDIPNPYIPRGGFLLAQAGDVLLEGNTVDGDVHGVVCLNQCRTWDSHIGVTTGNTNCVARNNTLRNIAGYTVGAITDCGQMPVLDWDDSNTVE